MTNENISQDLVFDKAAVRAKIDDATRELAADIIAGRLPAKSQPRPMTPPTRAPAPFAKHPPRRAGRPFAPAAQKRPLNTAQAPRAHRQRRQNAVSV